MFDFISNLFSRKNRQLPVRTLETIKPACKVCFIDDKNFNRVIDILKRDGWTNVSRIKDVEALEQQEIRDSHVLFVDIQGVGKKMGFADEGLGLIVALREKYKYKKIIVYSAEEPQKIKAFHKGMNDADYRLAKDTDPYEFERLLEIYAMECFSVEQCVERLYKIIHYCPLKMDGVKN